MKGPSQCGLCSLSLSSPLFSFVTHHCIRKPLQLSRRGRRDSGSPLIVLRGRHGTRAPEFDEFNSSSNHWLCSLFRRGWKKKKRDALQILAPSPLDEALVPLLHRASSPSSSPVWNSGYTAECGRRSRGQGGLPGADNEARPGRDRRPAAIFDVLRVVVVVDGGRAAAAGTGGRRRRRHDLGSPAPRRRRVDPGQRGRCQKSRKRWTSSGSSLASSPRVHLAAALRDRRGGRRRRRLFFLLFVVAVATSSGGLRRRRRRRHPRSPPRRLALLRRPPRRRRRGRPPPGQGPGVEHLPRGARGASGGRRALGGRRRGGRRRRVQPREVRLRDGGRKASSRFRHHHGRFESGEWERSLCLCVCLGGRAEREKKEIF